MAIMTIPRPLQIVMDDLGWFCSTDERASGGPSRTGVTRNHTAEDYYAVNELGKRLGMKIVCAFVVGEWDADNLLRSVKHLSNGEWDNASLFDGELMDKCVKAINESEYIDFAIHGLRHGYYMDGVDNTDLSDYYYAIDKKLTAIPEEEIRHRLDMFKKICEERGIKKQMNVFVPPSFAYRWNEISPILKQYGIEYISTIFGTMKCDGQKPEIADVENGIINVDRNNNIVKWNEFASDLSVKPDTVGIFGVHWPNVLHEDAQRSGEVVESWVKYFEKCSQNFGTILSKDMKFCATQSLFCRFAKISEDRGVTIVDVSDVPRLPQMDNCFYISSREPLESFVGCTFEDYETKDGFYTYKIKPITNKMRFDNV